MADYTYRDDQVVFVNPWGDIETAGGGPSYGTWKSEVLDLIVTDTTDQLHPYGQNGNDTLNLIFEDITGTAEGGHAHGHHARGDDTGDKDARTFSDTFNFKNVNEVSGDGTVVGRLEDFDSSRDLITIDGRPLLGTDSNGNYVNLIDSFAANNSDLVSSVEVVLYQGQHNDHGAEKQQWLLIETASGGTVFYALEGARVDMNGDGGSGGKDTDGDEVNDVFYQESHFLTELPNFATLSRTYYVDNHHYVPADGSIPDNLHIINDEDKEPDHVTKVIDGTSGADGIAAGLNDDVVKAGAGDDYVWGGSGSDTIFGEGGNDFVWGDSGNDLIYGVSGNDTISGGAGNDLIYGGSGVDNISGGAGNDRVFGGIGNDIINGGLGHDKLYGYAGNDTIMGSHGNDSLFGQDGNDILNGGAGNDSLNGGQGNDRLVGESGNDTLHGISGNNTMFGGSGDDQLHDGSGGSFLFGGVGSDIIHGNNGADRLYGEDGNDELYGGAGRDIVIGGAGNDTLYGGSGNDYFVFRDGFGSDVVKDFNPGEGDEINLVDVSWLNSFADVLEHSKISGNNVIVDDGAGNSIILEGILEGVDTNTNQLNADWFVF